MVRVADTADRVRLAPADWGGLCSLALAILSLGGATLYKLYDISQTHRERLAAVDAELSGLKHNVGLLQQDVRDLADRDWARREMR
jgi:type II secretory pathway component PulJ